MTTTGQPTVTTTTTTSETISPTNVPSIPSQTTTEPKPDKSNQSTSSKRPAVMTTEGSEGQGTRPLTDMSRSSSPATPAIRGARKEDSAQRVWVIPAVVGLSMLCLTALVVLLYFKCLKKRNTVARRHSTVKYNRRCSYVDMEVESDAAFGIRSNPTGAPIVYDNYPGDDSGYSEAKPREPIQGPVYEEIKDPTNCSEKSQRNNVYESMATMNDYETPQRTSRACAAHVYESATLPLKR
ncbi:uncharacterized protein LOC116291197 [Actinia tenebrosa]|uniref:Uncharacterized protein LOC116291197 n=1 Tax=Actinia tenebrosa TaxID=6105 RepID=A0A6P8HGX2_ACTTE|nr:uncharacterized protein LOC116291197 [Actinia tenebrosa]